MRILFVQKGLSLFASSGEYRANFSLLKHLASLGHDTAQICFSQGGEVDDCVAQVGAAKANLIKTILPFSRDDGSTVKVRMSTFTDVNGIRIIALDSTGFQKAFPEKTYTIESTDYIENEYLSSRMDTFIQFMFAQFDMFKPTHILFNDSLTLKATSRKPPGTDACRIFIIHSAEQLPCGPYAGGLPDSACSSKELDLLHDVDGIWAVSQAIKEYACQHGQLESTFLVHDKQTYLDEKTHEIPPQYHNWDRELIGMINPSDVKGVKIFIQIAKRLPNVKFAIWASWGSNAEIRERLRDVPNIELRESCRNMEEVWQELKVLLVPSLWFEAWGMVVTEAQLRGIPVISSDSGALPEAKLGVPYVIPVNSLTGEHDENGDYIVPEQHVGQWIAALDKLEDKAVYEAVATKARAKTVRWLSGLDPKAHEKWLSSMKK